MRKVVSTILVLALALTSLFAVPVNSSPAATVNLIRNTVITNADLAAQVEALGATDDQALEVLDIMINDEVFLQGAERDGITVSNTQRDALYTQQKASIEAQLGMSLTEDEFEQIVLQSYPSVDEYKEALKNQYILQAYLMQEKGEELQNGNYAPTSSQVETFYKRNATAFTQAENVKFFQIYMAKTDDADETAKKLATMEDAAEKIHNGSLTFEAAVNQYTEDEESKANGGEMGWLSSDNTTVRQLWGDDFVDTVLALPLGQVSDVIESNTGYHIVRVTVHNDARLLGIDDRIQPDVDYTVRDYITEILANQNMQVATNNALNEMVDALRSEARVRILYK